MNGESGRVTCDTADLSATCRCPSSSWGTALGTTEEVLLDSARWSRLEQSGPSPVLGVEAMTDDENPMQLPELPGAPNVLYVFERGDGSSGHLIREFSAGEVAQSGSIWFFKDGAFPRVLSLGDGQLVLLGVDAHSIWLQPGFDANGAPTTQRWVVQGVASRRWFNLSWNISLRSDDTYQLHATLQGVDGFYTEAFVAEDTGGSLGTFAADGGIFSFGDAGVPTSLQLGHSSATDGGTGILRVTGVTL